jgi:plastocyanin
MALGRRVVLLAAASLAAACGGSSNSGMVSTTSTSDGGTGSGGGATTVTVHIRNLAFSPENPSAPPGATVDVVNDDSPTVHSMTSEATAGSYTPGAVGGVSFDTGLFTGTKSFTIPSTAVMGTVIPFYCRNHLGMMVDALKLQLTIGPASSTPTTPMTPATPGGY